MTKITPDSKMDLGCGTVGVEVTYQKRQLMTFMDSDTFDRLLEAGASLFMADRRGKPYVLAQLPGQRPVYLARFAFGEPQGLEVHHDFLDSVRPYTLNNTRDCLRILSASEHRAVHTAHNRQLKEKEAQA